MKALQVISNGAPLEALRVVDIDAPTPGDGQVRIKVAAASLNFNDIDRCYGRRISVPLTPPFTLGMDACGVVDAVGAGAESWLGKRVVALTFYATGGLAEYAIAPAASVFDAPPRMTDAEAAAFIIPFHTAYLALVRRARLSQGETVLVHAGASSVGAAAIQIGRALGARVLTTVGSAEKAAFCTRLGAELTIAHRTQKFDEAVLDHTGDIGADVILDLVGGAFVEPSWRCVAREGRYIAAGFADDEINGFTGRPLRPSCAGNFSIIGVMLAWTGAVPPELRRMGFNMFGRDVADAVHGALLQWIDAGKIHSVLQRTVPLDGAAAALTEQEQRATLGRTVVSFTL
jgi:NADPH2:quinone reductase